MILEDIKLISFVDLTIEKQKMILEWRNHESIRKWIYSCEPISEMNHFEFIKKLKFKEFIQKTINNQEIVYMELKNENR